MNPYLVISPTLVHGTGSNEFEIYIRYLAVLHTRFGELTMPFRDVRVGEADAVHDEARRLIRKDAITCIAELARQFAA